MNYGFDGEKISIELSIYPEIANNYYVAIGFEIDDKLSDMVVCT